MSGAGGCAQPFYHPISDCAKYGVAANRGLPHFPHVDPRTFRTVTKLEGFKAAAGFKASMSPTSLKLTSMTLDSYDAAWDDVEFELPALGAFRAQENAIKGALAKSFEDHWKTTAGPRAIVEKTFNEILGNATAACNAQVNFTNFLRLESGRRLVSSAGRRLAHADIEHGQMYTVSSDGQVAHKEEDPVDETPVEEEDEETIEEDAPERSLAEATYLGLDPDDAANPVKINAVSGLAETGSSESSGATTVTDARDSVVLTFNVYNIIFSKLSDDNVLALAKATKDATVAFAAVQADDVVSMAQVLCRKFATVSRNAKRSRLRF
jgi:hypothetical protein